MDLMLDAYCLDLLFPVGGDRLDLLGSLDRQLRYVIHPWDRVSALNQQQHQGYKPNQDKILQQETPLLNRQPKPSDSVPIQSLYPFKKLPEIKKVANQNIP
jgi:hypothetical protein